MIYTSHEPRILHLPHIPHTLKSALRPSIASVPPEPEPIRKPPETITSALHKLYLRDDRGSFKGKANGDSKVPKVKPSFRPTPSVEAESRPAPFCQDLAFHQRLLHEQAQNHRRLYNQSVQSDKQFQILKGKLVRQGLEDDG